jgi:hypothetical protein
MKPWTADIKSFSIAGLTNINPKKAKTAIDATVGLDRDLILRQKYDKHQTDHLTRHRKARELLERLPEPGEVFTVLMSGAFDGWDFVQAILDLSAPRTIEELYVATLGFNDTNAAHLLNQLDKGTIGKVWFVASCYMRDKHGSKFADLYRILNSRGHQIKATRNHAKLIAMKLTDGTTICIDGSLNLCSCQNVEQAHVWNDETIFHFYSQYIRGQTATKDHIK